MTRRATFTQADVTRLVKGYVAAGLPVPQVIIEGEQIKAVPVAEQEHVEKTPLDRKYGL